MLRIFRAAAPGGFSGLKSCCCAPQTVKPLLSFLITFLEYWDCCRHARLEIYTVGRSYNCGSPSTDVWISLVYLYHYVKYISLSRSVQTFYVQGVVLNFRRENVVSTSKDGSSLYKHRPGTRYWSSCTQSTISWDYSVTKKTMLVWALQPRDVCSDDMSWEHFRWHPMMNWI